MIQIDKIWVTDTAVHIMTIDGKEASENFNDYPRLRYATKEQISNFTISAFGIHWEDVDEDLSFDGFFNTKIRTLLYNIFISHPELNASAIARRLQMKQSLLASYINGTKKPSQKREQLILNEIQKVGKELMSIDF